MVNLRPRRSLSAAPTGPAAVPQPSGPVEPKGSPPTPIPGTDAVVGRTRVRAVIDTGAQLTSGNLALRQALLERKRLDEHPDEIIGVTGDSQEGPTSSVPPIVLGDVSVRNANITFVDLHIFKHWKLTDEPALLIGITLGATLLINLPQAPALLALGTFAYLSRSFTGQVRHDIDESLSRAAIGLEQRLAERAEGLSVTARVIAGPSTGASTSAWIEPSSISWSTMPADAPSRISMTTGL